MFEVKNADKRLLDSLEKNEKAMRATIWKVVYGILKTLGIVSTGVALVNFGVMGAIIATVISVFVLSFSWVSKVTSKEELDSENEKKVELAVEIASKLGVEINPKTLHPELVATLDETKKATFVQDGEEITYGDRGKKKFYYKYSDANGDNHILEETTTYYDEYKLMPFSNISGYGGYTTMVNTSHIVNGLEQVDEEALPREVVIQIINHEANKQQTEKKHAKTKKKRQG